MTSIKDLKDLISRALTNYSLECGMIARELPLNDIINVNDGNGVVEIHAVTLNNAVRWSGGEIPLESLSEDSITDIADCIRDEYEID